MVITKGVANESAVAVANSIWTSAVKKQICAKVIQPPRKTAIQYFGIIKECLYSLSFVEKRNINKIGIRPNILRYKEIWNVE